MKIGAWYTKDKGCEFTVWAPNAESVTLELLNPQKREVPMNRLEDSYWNVLVEDIEPGTLYQYRLDDKGSYSDPASFFQPQGVHAPSQVVDFAFDWSDRDWQGVPLEDYVIYELHVGTFTQEGTFAAIIPRLPDLRDLGITAIEVMPIAQFPGDHITDEGLAYRNWGYDGVFPFAVQNSYGTPTEFKQFVDACHQQNIAVVLDVVYNHFGPEGNYVNNFGHYFTQTYKTLWGEAINFDGPHSYPVRSYFFQNALFWLKEFHVDSLRLDAVQAIFDLGAKHFLEELAQKIDELSAQQGRKHYLIAESDLNDARLIRSPDLGGYGLDAQWSDDFHHALFALLTGENRLYYQDFGKCEDLAKAYQSSFVYDWKYAPHRSRYHGSSAEDCSPKQFVVCIQNHDQVGNCLPGDRLAKQVSFEGLKLAAGAVILSPYIPLLFMGEEYGEDALFMYFVSHSDPDLIRAVRQGRTQEFEDFHLDMEPSDPEAVETFLGSKLNWEKRKEGNNQILWSFYQHLIRLRRTLPALIKRDRQCLKTGFDEANKLVYWHRWSEDQQLLCLMNFNQESIHIQPPLPDISWRKLLDSTESKWAGVGSTSPEKLTAEQHSVTLSPQSLVLYEAPSNL